MDELKTNSRLLVVAPSKFVRYSPKIDRMEVFCSFESIFQYYYALHSRSGFHLMPKIDEWLLRFSEAGLSSTNWRVFNLYDKRILNRKSSMFNTVIVNAVRFDVAGYKSSPNISLNLEHIEGAICILIAGCLFALIVFCLEITAKKLSANSSHKLILFLAYALDPLRQ